MKRLTLNLPEPLIQAFLELSEYVCELLGNRGCNDFTLSDNPDNRELCDLLAAYNLGISVQEWRDMPDGKKQPELVRDGKIYLMDFEILGLFAAMVQSQVEGTN